MLALVSADIMCAKWMPFNSMLKCLMIDRRKSQCYLDTGDDFPRGRRPGQFGRRECARPIGDLMTRATCCCSVGSLWGITISAKTELFSLRKFKLFSLF